MGFRVFFGLYFGKHGLTEGDIYGVSTFFGRGLSAPLLLALSVCFRCSNLNSVIDPIRCPPICNDS